MRTRIQLKDVVIKEYGHWEIVIQLEEYDSPQKLYAVIKKYGHREPQRNREP